MMTGLITAVGLSFHNFPEGIAVYLASLKGLRFGVPLAIAISLHNLPEGVAVALPIYGATSDKWQAVKFAFISGLFEPLGVICSSFFLKPLLTETLVQNMLASVAGIMTFLSLYELLPLSIKHCKRKKATFSVFLGMFVTAAVLGLLKHYENQYQDL
eukprot:TRINITY_DN6120_c0_g1_i1.p1 TRINITY_DN6120_c0_g1~~TRINITY_DN6120_c0_g1_i1.p1  ORF type:complete len:157 (+),score=28.48 TRINITY_DN6120_c0_g1_i1:567-1037(+)